MADPPLILVVDDEQSYRDALSVALQREGFLVETAADGPEAIANLLDNAIKYTDRGGVRVRVETGDGRVACAVTDTGAGIPTEDQSRIFERFYRVDRARSRDTGGTGLGLAIVRHVAQVHGGEVTVESREGEGSTFTLYLPLANGGPRALSEAS